MPDTERMDTGGNDKQVLVYWGTGDKEDLWVGFSDDVTFAEAVRAMNALASLADERKLWVYVVNGWHTGVLVWSQQNASVWEPGTGLQAVNACRRFWQVVRTAPVELVADPALTAPLLLGVEGVPDSAEACVEDAGQL